MNRICEKYHTEEETIVNCSNLNIISINTNEIGSGKYGTVYTIKTQKSQILVVKRTIVELYNNTKKDMDDEIEYSIIMGKLNIGPKVFDSFYYQTSKHFNQYIIMEKFDESVKKFIRRRKLDEYTCKHTSKTMLRLLKKQIFISGIYCSDIKPENYVVKFYPVFKIRMIDFGWCNKTIINTYSGYPELKKYSQKELNEIFYAFCAMQLLLKVYGTVQNQNNKKIKWLIEPFFKDAIFKKYIYNKSSRKQNTSYDTRKILNDILSKDNDQSINLKHYLSGEYTKNEDIIEYILGNINAIAEKYL